MKNWICPECNSHSQTDDNIVMSICGGCQVAREENHSYKFEPRVEVKEE